LSVCLKVYESSPLESFSFFVCFLF
jgi:hypothetical protein